MLFPTVKVPGLDDIEIFRDHEKSDTFYALRGRPRIALDEKWFLYISNPEQQLIKARRHYDIHNFVGAVFFEDIDNST